MTLIMTAAHAGYSSERVPLGGGAAICERLCRAWAGRKDVLVVGSGPDAPPGLEYVQVDRLHGRHPAQLNEWEYARFCRSFERATTELILKRAERHPVRVLTHDISEGPDFGELARRQVPCAPIFHVDVVEFFCKIYLRGMIRPHYATMLHRWLGWLPLPDVLRLVFDKQAQAVARCPRLVVPSAGMVEVLARCYPRLDRSKVQVVNWGAEPQPCSPEALERAQEALRKRWLLGPGPVLATLSRISPEKGHDLLLSALAEGERRNQAPENLTLLIIGSAAYMGGTRTLRRLERMASSLRRTRVIFAGHLGGLEKRAALGMATLFVVPSRHESYGLTTMEAMEAGLPVVALETHGTRATLQNGGGVLVRMPSQLWSAIRDLLSDPVRRLQLSEEARRESAAHPFAEAAARLLSVL